MVLLCRRHVTFINKEGDSHTFQVADGITLLDVARSQGLEIEGLLPLRFADTPTTMKIQLFG